VSQFELVVLLLAGAIPLVLLARKMNLGYPIVLVLAGLGLGLVPGLPEVKLPPEIILVIFLPPLLFWEATTSPTRAYRAFAQPILRLAVGLVFVTTGCVAWLAHAFVPALPWAAAFAFGAIVSPTDEVAFMPVAERFNLPHRVVAIVEGESLLNDAVSLVIYAVAVTAAVSATFSWWHAGLQLALTIVGSVAIGIAAGFIIIRVYLLVREPMLIVLTSLIAGYLAYIPATHLGLSGVLATVTSAFFASRFMPAGVAPEARVLTRGAWSVLIFVLNTTIFILVGLQLGPLLRNLHDTSIPQLVLEIVVVNVAIVGVRIIWTMGIAYPIDRFVRHFEDIPPWRNYALTAWTGLRGGVSLAAALAIPLTIAAGRPFPHRDLLIVLTYSVIVVTLVGQGATLPLVVRLLRIPNDDLEEREEQQARVAITKTSLERLAQLARDGKVDAAIAKRLTERYERHALDSAQKGSVDAFHEAEQRLLVFQHEELFALRRRGEIENTVMRHLEMQLDLKRLQLDEELEHGGPHESETIASSVGDAPKPT
jgi:CPA1 family monovalent cation:H+ antiporter